MHAQYGSFGAALAAIGAFGQWRRWGRAISLGFSLAFILGSFGVLLRLDTDDYEFLSRAVVRVYPIIPYGIMAIWVALGFERVLAYLARLCPATMPASGDSTHRHRWSFGAAVPVILCSAFIAYVGWSNLRFNDRHDYDFSRDYAVTILEALAPGAVVVVHSDFDTNVLQYFHYLEGVRPDVSIINDQGLGMAPDGRLFEPTRLTAAEKQDRVRRLLQRTDRPVYVFTEPPTDLGDEELGLYYRMNVPNAGRRTYTVEGPLLEFYRRVERQAELTDPWTIATRSAVIGRMASLLAAVVHLHPDTEYRERYRADLDRASTVFEGLVNRIGVLESAGGVESIELLAWTEKAAQLADDTVAKRARATLYLLRGRLLAKLDRLPGAIAAYEESFRIYPHPQNAANDELVALRARISAARKIHTKDSRVIP
jgi:hypothetical protein